MPAPAGCGRVHRPAPETLKAPEQPGAFTLSARYLDTFHLEFYLRDALAQFLSSAQRGTLGGVGGQSVGGQRAAEALRTSACHGCVWALIDVDVCLVHVGAILQLPH